MRDCIAVVLANEKMPRAPDVIVLYLKFCCFMTQEIILEKCFVDADKPELINFNNRHSCIKIDPE
jgi:hypothetical protein